MNGPTGALLSVRGEARRTVAPDLVLLPATLTVSRSSTAEALRDAATAWERIVAKLRSLGGVPLTVETERRPLTWSARSATTSVEHEPDPRTGRYEPTGLVTAAVAVVITVRDFAALGPLSTALAAHDAFAVHHADWRVDADNPGWAEVRAAAVTAAIAKGRDYAAALGGSLHHVEHLADAGLLADSDDPAPRRLARAAPLSFSEDGEEPDTPALDPVPQELSAAVDARFMATGVSLAGR